MLLISHWLLSAQRGKNPFMGERNSLRPSRLRVAAACKILNSSFRSLFIHAELCSAFVSFCFFFCVSFFSFVAFFCRTKGIFVDVCVVITRDTKTHSMEYLSRLTLLLPRICFSLYSNQSLICFETYAWELSAKCNRKGNLSDGNRPHEANWRVNKYQETRDGNQRKLQLQRCFCSFLFARLCLCLQSDKICQKKVFL